MPTFGGYYGDFAAAKRRREKLAARKHMKWERIKAGFAAARSVAALQP